MKKIILPAVIGSCVFLGSTKAYALFGEENITLVKQLYHLIKISRDVSDTLSEARETVDLAYEARDQVFEAKALVEELNSYTTDRFIEDFKRDVLNTYPDLDYIIKKTGSQSLADWNSGNMKTPMGSYELIGHVFGEVTEDVRNAQIEERTKTDDATLYRYEAAAALTAAENAGEFLDKSDADIEVLSEQLKNATEEEAVVIQAKIQAVVAAQNSHLMRMQSMLLRRQGTEDARNYQRSIQAKQFALDIEKDQESISASLNKRPKMMEFNNLWMELE